MLTSCLKGTVICPLCCCWIFPVHYFALVPFLPLLNRRHSVPCSTVSHCSVLGLCRTSLEQSFKKRYTILLSLETVNNRGYKQIEECYEDKSIETAYFKFTVLIIEFAIRVRTTEAYRSIAKQTVF